MEVLFSMIVFFLLLVKDINGSLLTKEAFATRSQNVKLLNAPNDTILDIETLNKCLLMCTKAQNCKGFNYGDDSFRCELYETVECGRLGNRKGWNLGQLVTGNNDLQILGNVALNKMAYQSSTYRAAEKAVDGNTDGMMDQTDSCAHTVDWTYPQWWIVDLGKPYILSQIIIWNRFEGLGFRLHDFSIEVACEFDGENLDTGCWRRQYLHPGTPAINPVVVPLSNPSIGRFVKIENAVESHSAFPPDDLLTLCEVEIFAKFEDNKCECEVLDLV